MADVPDGRRRPDLRPGRVLPQVRRQGDRGPPPRQRYYDETRRVLGVLDRQLQGCDWITGDYSVADIATAPWVRNLRNGYQAQAETGLDEHPNVLAWIARFEERPAVQRGLTIPAAPG